MTGRIVADAAGSVVSVADPGGLLRAYEAASMYYIQGETMEVIIHHLGASRLTVSRLLVRVRQEGVVRVSLVQPGGAGSLEGRIAQVFRVRAHIVPMREGTTEIHCLEQTASVAAVHMVDLIEALAESGQGRGVGASESGGPEGDKPPVAGEPTGSGRDADAGGVVVGVAWGTTMSEASAALPLRPVSELTVIQLNGASDPAWEGSNVGEVLSRMCLLLGVRIISSPVPVFFDHMTTYEAMWLERSVKRALPVVWRASLAVFGVGAFDALNEALPSRVYEGGHLTARGQAVLRRQNVVGDMCAVLLCAGGPRRDVTLNARVTGPTPAQLARIPRHLCAAAGIGKSRVLLAVLRARTAMDPVVDDATARAVLELTEARDQKGGGSR